MFLPFGKNELFMKNVASIQYTFKNALLCRSNTIHHLHRVYLCGFQTHVTPKVSDINR